MGRLPSIIQHANGGFETRVVFPPTLWRLLEDVGTKYASVIGERAQPKQPSTIGIKLLFRALEELIAEGDLKCLRDPIFQEALKGKTHRESSLPEGFDRSVLHTSLKLKSRYVGVITYGPCFEARARHESCFGSIRLGTFKTAELAAYARYLYYLKHESLAYGEAEDEVEYMRKMDASLATRTDVEIWPEVAGHLKITERLHLVTGPRCVSLLPGPREPQIIARKQAPQIDTSHGRQLFGAPVDLTSASSASAPDDHSANYHGVSSTVAIGFEDGDLPECFNDNWIPGGGLAPVETEPQKRKRGRPRKYPRPL